MRLAGKTIGIAMTGSFCTIPQVLPEIEKLVKEGASVYPILSEKVATLNTKYGKAADIVCALERITGKEPILTIAEVEPLGPGKTLDALVIAPCTGNTLAKLAYGITDGPVLMAAKSTMRNLRPVIIGISTNDALSRNAKNLGALLNEKHIFMIPFRQDAPFEKPCSLISDMRLLVDTVVLALDGKQLQPILVDTNS
ncbi:MAG: dipicolinate synthase subunit B [Bacillota bacterium]|jgi:dipicolinate synthase subunit B|nr:dipicolinate synthase subunit B [Bacillota bacterium]MDI9415379.1 dipicolinate synthase subunit B [Bacillota bacterium]NLD12372.1 dipicolinate synthase subunit B [Bacillota bacterium]HAV20607.1 dipicolinate synthase subunit B [Bacillota bacterium]HOB88116.1 dipicolinate synthase subunit B [Bacillota bacterium]